MPFSFRRLSKLQLLSVCFVAFIAMLGFAAGKRDWFGTNKFKATNRSVSQKVVAAGQATPPPITKSDHVERQRLRWDLQSQFKLLGDRLEKPGKERIIMTGTVNRPNAKADTVPVRLIVELPDKVRLEELNGDKAGITIHDGTDLKSSRKGLSKADENEIESLVFDSIDHLLIGQMQGNATRFLGSHFRLDDGSNPAYNGPFYEVFQISENLSMKKDIVRQQLKTYYFNSSSQLLEKIRYSLAQPNDKPVAVEIQLAGWKQFEGQYLPTSFTRLEDGSPVFVLAIKSVSLGKKAEDGIFVNF